MSDLSSQSGMSRSIGIRYHEAADGIDMETGQPIVVLQVMDDNGAERTYHMSPDMAATLALGLITAAGKAT